MADWEEIKRLAADFQRTQTSDTLQRISERNCIDIVKKLTELGLIELIYTCDGKEFITPNHLIKEIEDEVYVNGGRVHLHDLSANLNVDYQHVENKSKDLIRDKPDEYNLIQGQIIHSTYKNTLGKQIQDTMIEAGQLSIADFAKSLDLPSEFLLSVIKDVLPKIMDDFVVSSDERTYYSGDMMDRYRSIIAGTLSAITKPTTIASIIKRIDIPERLFTSIVEELIKEGRIDATVENRLFIPAVYAREQNEWIDGFYSSNSYIDYDLLLRKDIKQPKAYLNKRFPGGIPLKTCFVNPSLISQVESLVEDCIASNGLIDISSILPPSIQPEDIEQILQDLFKKNSQFASSCLLFNQTNVCSVGYVANCKKSFNDLMHNKANEQLRQGKLMNHFMGGKLKVAPKRMNPNQSRNDNPTSDDNSESKNNDEVKKNDDQAGGGGDRGDEENKEPDDTQGTPRGPAAAGEKPKKVISEDFEMTPEDIKREKRNKNKSSSKTNQADNLDSDDDQQGNKKSKGSRKSGGGTQGREIKQKSVKKKYNPGNKGKGQNDYSDDEPEPMTANKAPRSNKGRAARRAISPERTPTTSQKDQKSSRGPQMKERSSSAPTKEPLVFMNLDEIAMKLRNDSRELGDFSDDLFELLAGQLEDELNKKYESVAKQTLDEFLKTQAERGEAQDDDEKSKDEDDDVVELIE